MLEEEHQENKRERERERERRDGEIEEQKLNELGALNMK